MFVFSPFLLFKHALKRLSVIAIVLVGGGSYQCVRPPRHNTGFALTHVSAYITHKNLAVRKIVEAMRTGYAEKRVSVSTRLKK